MDEPRDGRRNILSGLGFVRAKESYFPFSLQIYMGENDGMIVEINESIN